MTSMYGQPANTQQGGVISVPYQPAFYGNISTSTPIFQAVPVPSESGTLVRAPVGVPMNNYQAPPPSHPVPWQGAQQAYNWQAAAQVASLPAYCAPIQGLSQPVQQQQTLARHQMHPGMSTSYPSMPDYRMEPSVQTQQVTQTQPVASAYSTTARLYDSNSYQNVRAHDNTAQYHNPVNNNCQPFVALPSKEVPIIYGTMHLQPLNLSMMAQNSQSLPNPGSAIAQYLKPQDMIPYQSSQMVGYQSTIQQPQPYQQQPIYQPAWQQPSLPTPNFNVGNNITPVYFDLGIGPKEKACVIRIEWQKYDGTTRSRDVKGVDENGNTVECVIKFFCTVRKGDVMSCTLFKRDQYSKWEVKKNPPPFVRTCTDDTSYVSGFMMALNNTGFNANDGARLYKFFEELAKKELQKEVVDGKEIAIAISNLVQLSVLTVNSMKPLTEIPMLNDEQRVLFKNWWLKEEERCLNLMGVDSKTLRKVEGRTISQIYIQAMKDPYAIVEFDIDLCNKLMKNMGRTPTEPEIERAIIARGLHLLNNSKGYTGVSLQQAKSRFPNIHNHVKNLIEDYDMILDSDIDKSGILYFKYPYVVETRIARKLTDMIIDNFFPQDPERAQSPSKLAFPQKLRDSLSGPQFCNTSLDNVQKEAVIGALTKEVCIITGPAGAGKTTIVQEIVHNLKIQQVPFVVCSYTGKAVSRLKQVLKYSYSVGGSDLKPCTLHRLISMMKGGTEFKPKYVIMDETSTITSALLYEFDKACANYFRLVMIGDVNQLQPIGCGALFEESHKCNAIPIYRLTKVYRTLPTSGVNGIQVNTERIISNEPFLDTNGNPCNFYLSAFDNFQIFNIQPEGESEGHMQIADQRIKHTTQQILETLKGANIKLDDVAIINPYNKYITPMNELMQEVYNSTHDYFIDMNKKRWCVGDRIMMENNNYDIEIMNGETGIIVSIMEDKIKVKFENGDSFDFLKYYVTEINGTEDKDSILRPATDIVFMHGSGYRKVIENGVEKLIPLKELSLKEIGIAMCFTTYKMQGSEYLYTICVIPLHKSNKSCLHKRSNYTMLSRARVGVYLLGDVTNFEKGCAREPPYRCDMLAERIKRHIMKEVPLIEERLRKLGLLESLQAINMDEFEGSDEIPDFLDIEPDFD